LPIAMAAVDAAHDVVGYEIDAYRSACLREGSSYVEDIPDAVLEAALGTGRYLPTPSISDCAGFDVAVITVPTPLRDGVPDLGYIEQSARDLAPLVRSGSTVILESTTYPGTTEELVAPILEIGSGLRAGEDFHLGYSPERIDPGNDNWRLENTPKVVSGIDPESLKTVSAFYEAIVATVVPVSSTRVAEMTKLLENTFRHVNIALVNELAIFAEQLGVDVWEAIAAASTKPFGFMPFTPGPGVGGHCLPVDPSYLSWKVKQAVGSPFRFIELANDINAHMPDYVTQRVARALNRDHKAVNGSRIVVLGLSYKRNTGDARESPGPVICQRLMEMGAVVAAVDPHLSDRAFPAGVARIRLEQPDLAAADLIILATDHDLFDFDLLVRCGRPVLDTRHRLPPSPGVEYL
jgi:UDP-N-acetyl-D-glucosamine dehydrogenase